MREPGRARLVLMCCSALLAVLAVATAGAQAAVQLLPDLDPAAPGRPTAVSATDGSGRVFLTFSATFNNTGAGPLVLRGHRASTAEPTMVGDQVVRLDDGSEAVVPAVGSFSYDAQYRRWGFSPYISYELRYPDGSPIGTGPDLGFCVMDTKNTDKRVVLPGEPSRPVYKESPGCGRGNPSLLALEEGVSVGWGNLHSAGNKGQMIDITGLPSGQYVLVHRVNALGFLTESNLANNASSALVSVTWVSGQTLPTVSVVRSCADAETC